MTVLPRNSGRAQTQTVHEHPMSMMSCAPTYVQPACYRFPCIYAYVPMGLCCPCVLVLVGAECGWQKRFCASCSRDEAEACRSQKLARIQRKRRFSKLLEPWLCRRVTTRVPCARVQSHKRWTMLLRLLIFMFVPPKCVAEVSAMLCLLCLG